MGDGAKGEEKLGAREQVRVASKPGQVAQALTCVILEYPSICPSQHVPAFPAPGRPRLLPSLHASMCSSSPLWEKTQNGQHAVSLCPWCSRVQLSPGLSCSPPTPRHSPAQGKELAVAVERHVPQVEDLQSGEVAHVRDVAHFVALQVEASDLGTKASKGTRGNLQQSQGESGGS